MNIARLIGALEARGARRLEHSGGRPLLAHLVGTRAILARWKQPPSLQRAGLFHSCYSTEDFTHALYAPKERAVVRGMIGRDAEALAHLFCTVDRDHLYRSLGELPIAAAAIARLLVLDLANLAEQAADPANNGPGIWMAAASRIAAPIRGRHRPVPPVFGRCRVLLDPQAELDARASYLRAERARSTSTRRELYARAAELNPWIGEPHLGLARVELAVGRSALAKKHARAAVSRFAAWGVAWDKRKSFEAWIAEARAFR